MTRVASTTRKRRKPPPAPTHYPAGSREAIGIIRGWIATEARQRRERGWRVELERLRRKPARSKAR